MHFSDSNLKKKVVHEIELYFLYASFLALFFSSMTLYQRLILGEFSIGYVHYSYGIVQALILAKIILLGETFGLGEKYEEKPLIIPTLYKAVIFTLFSLLFSVLEHFVVGYFEGHSLHAIYDKFMGRGLDDDLAKLLVVFLVFCLFFAFIETGRVFGEDKLLKLFFSKKASRIK